MASMRASEKEAPMSESASQTENQTLASSLKKTIFTVLLVVIKEDQKPRHWVWTAATLVIDLFQLLSFALVGGVSVDFGIVQNFSSFTEKFRLYSELASSLGGFMAALYISWAWILLIFASLYYVFKSCQQGNVKYIFPFKFLRFSISVSLAVLFIPIAQILLFVVDCNYFSNPLQHYFLAGMACWDTSHSIHSFVSILLLFAFSGLLAIMTLVYFDYKPGRLMSKAHGRLDFLHLACRLSLCLNVTFFHSGGGLALFSSIALLFLSTVMTIATLYFLPYYSMPINCVKSGTYFAFLWASLCTFIAIMSDNTISSGTLSTMVFVGVPLFFIFGFVFVRYLYIRIWENCLQGIFWCKHHVEIATRFFFFYHYKIRTAKNQAVLDRLTSPDQPPSAAATPLQLPTPNHHVQSQPKAQPSTSKTTATPTPTTEQPNATTKMGMAKGILAKKFSPKLKQIFGTTRLDLADITPQRYKGGNGVEAPQTIKSQYLEKEAKKILKLQVEMEFGLEKLRDALECGMIAFPDDPFLIICNALHAEISFQDPVLSIKLFSQVSDCPTAKLDLCFLSHRCVEERRRGGGSVGAVASSHTDVISQFELARDMKALKRSHLRALKALLEFWEALSDHQVLLQAIETALFNLNKWEGEAEQVFKSILKRTPENPRILRSYASFLLEVKRDSLKAAQMLHEADEVEEASGKASHIQALQELEAHDAPFDSQPSYGSRPLPPIPPQDNGRVTQVLQTYAFPISRSGSQLSNFNLQPTPVTEYHFPAYHRENYGRGSVAQHPSANGEWNSTHAERRNSNPQSVPITPTMSRSVSFADVDEFSELPTPAHFAPSPARAALPAPAPAEPAPPVPPSHESNPTKKKKKLSRKKMEAMMQTARLSPDILRQHNMSNNSLHDLLPTMQRTGSNVSRRMMSEVVIQIGTSTSVDSLSQVETVGEAMGQNEMEDDGGFAQFALQSAQSFTGHSVGERSKSSGDTSYTNKGLATSIAKLQKILEQGKISNKNLRRLQFAMRVIFCIIFVMNIITVATIISDFQTLKEHCSVWLFGASWRNGLLTLIWYNIKTITLAAGMISGVISDAPSFLDLHAIMDDAKAKLTTYTTELEALHLQVWDHVKTVPGAHRDYFLDYSMTGITSNIPQSAQAQVQQYTDWTYRNVPTSTYTTNFLSLGNDFMKKAFAVIQANETLPAGYNNHFIRMNMDTMFNGYLAGKKFFLQEALSKISRIQVMQGTFLAVSLLVFVFMAVFLFVIILPHLEKEKVKVLNFIVGTPRTVCTMMAQRVQSAMDQEEEGADEMETRDPPVPFSEVDFSQYFPAPKRELEYMRSQGQIRLMWRISFLLTLLFSCFIAYCSVGLIAANNSHVAAIDLNWPIRSYIIYAFAYVQEVATCDNADWCAWAAQNLRAMQKLVDGYVVDFVEGRNGYKGALGRFDDLDAFLTTCDPSRECTVPTNNAPIAGFIHIAELYSQQISLILTEDPTLVNLEYPEVGALHFLFLRYLEDSVKIFKMLISHITNSFDQYILAFCITLACAVALLVWIHIIVEKRVIQTMGQEMCRIDLCLLLLPMEAIEFMPELKGYLMTRAKTLESGSK